MNSVYFRTLAQSSAMDLERILSVSKGPSIESLAGSEWIGFNTTWRLKILGLQKFMKGFFQAGASLEGYNIPVVQNGLDGPWSPLPAPDNPSHYAFYRITKVDRESRDHFYPDAIFLDYSANPKNAGSSIANLIRDYVVQPDPENPDILLGKAYLALGPFRIASNFFILERHRPVSRQP